MNQPFDEEDGGCPDSGVAVTARAPIITFESVFMLIPPEPVY